MALVLGGILLGAGVLLFVAAHWDEVSPGTRLTLVMAMLALFHGAGIGSRGAVRRLCDDHACAGDGCRAARRLRWWGRSSTCRSTGRRR